MTDCHKVMHQDGHFSWCRIVMACGSIRVSWTLQVLNMKPPEILSMLEEAAGTRMYENKKDAALKTLEKKQIKVEEINKVMSRDLSSHLSAIVHKAAGDLATCWRPIA